MIGLFSPPPRPPLPVPPPLRIIEPPPDVVEDKEYKFVQSEVYELGDVVTL